MDFILATNNMKKLAETLDSDSFCEYLKDRGITRI